MSLARSPSWLARSTKRENKKFRIAIIRLRNGDALRNTGQKALARTIKRIFAYLL